MQCYNIIYNVYRAGIERLAIGRLSGAKCQRMGVESLNEKAVTDVTGALRFNSSSAVTVLNKISNSPSVFRKGYFL